MNNNKNYLIFFRFFGLILFIYVLLRIDFSQLIITLKKINVFYYLIGLFCLVSAFLTRVLRLKTLVNSIEAESSFSDLAKILAKGILLGIATPGKLGEFWQTKYLADITRTSGGRAFFATFLDRASDLLIMGIVSIFSIIVFSFKFGIGLKWEVYVLILTLLSILIFFLIRKMWTQRMFKGLIKIFIPLSLKGKTEFFLDEFFQSFKELNSLLFLKVLGYGFLYYLTAVLMHYFVTLSLGLTIPFWYLFLIVALSWLAMILPITFLGLGTREAVFVYFFSILGISAPLAVAASLLVLFSNILMTIPGVIMFFKKA